MMKAVLLVVVQLHSAQRFQGEVQALQTLPVSCIQRFVMIELMQL